MTITNYTKHSKNPLLPEAFQYLKRRDIFAIDYTHRQIGVSNEAAGFSLYTFEKELLWEVDKPIGDVLLLIDRQQIWLAERHNAQKITIWVYDLQGNALASLPMKDEIVDANIGLKALPNNKVIITFYGGQDGAMSSLLSFEDKKLTIVKKLPDDIDFCCMMSEKEAIFVDFYEAKLYIMSYPQLKTRKEYQFSEDWGVVAQPFEGTKILITDLNCNRHYIFDLRTMTIEEEITFKGFEPYQEEGEDFLVTDIDELHYHNGQWIATYMEVDSQRNAVFYWLVSENRDK